jgi:hypothetical protein
MFLSIGGDALIEWFKKKYIYCKDASNSLKKDRGYHMTPENNTV